MSCVLVPLYETIIHNKYGNVKTINYLGETNFANLIYQQSLLPPPPTSTLKTLFHSIREKDFSYYKFGISNCSLLRRKFNIRNSATSNLIKAGPLEKD